LKVAIVCDWLTGTGGAERVVLELHKLFPKAPIYTSQYNKNPKIWYGDTWFEDADIRTGWLQKLPKSLKKFLPIFRAWYFSRLDLSAYDLVISSSGAEAKFVKVKEGAIHITYCHAPTHYYWMRYEDYLQHPGFGVADPLARLALKFLVNPMRRWDYKAAQRPDYFIANSNFTKKQIKKYYEREAEVIHPPVDIERFMSHVKPAAERHGLVVAGRQTPYKRIDLAVAAANKADATLVVVGRGPQHQLLRRIAGRKITFFTNVSDSEMPEKFGEAKALIFPNVDDFGITAVEALAAGTPVIAYRIGGQRDFINSKNGIIFDEQTSDSLTAAIKKIDGKSFNYEQISKSTKQFAAKEFQHKINSFIKAKIPKS